MHPDKNPSPEARAAFDALNVAQRHLLDAAKRGEYVREEGEKQLAQLTHDQPARARAVASPLLLF